MKRKTFPIAAMMLWHGLLLLDANAQESPTDTLQKQKIEEVSIEGKYYRQYNIPSASSSLRIQGKILEAPQNIQIISKDVLADQMAFNLNESITRNVSGSMREELHNGISPDIYARGGYINAQRNGVDMRPIIKGPLSDDAAIVETIEFVKGPAGFMTAMSDPAGSYNIITKKPMWSTRNTFRLTYGSFRTMRAEADLQGILDSAQRFAYRINLMGMNSNGFMDHDNSERFLVAPSLSYRPDSSTLITAEMIYQKLNYMLLSEAQISPYGYGSLPVNFSISDPNIRPYRAEDLNLFLTARHQWRPGWTLNAAVSNISNSYAGSIFWVYGKNQTDEDQLDRYLVYDGMEYRVFSTQTFIQGEYRTGSVKHRFLGGIDLNDKTNKGTDTWNTASAIYPLTISNPLYGEVVNNHGNGGSFDSENDITGQENNTKGSIFYLSAHAMNESTLASGKFKLNYGLRITRSLADFNNYGDETEAKDLVVTPRLGASYLPTSDLNVYALYDQSYLPQAGVAHDGTALHPLTGESYELGIKKDWSEGKWNSSLSVYRIDRNRTLITDPATNEVYQTGQNRSEGVEFDVRGQLTRGLNVVINYAYTDSRITKDEKNPQMVGMATPNRVRHIQNTWISYDFSPRSSLRGLSLSGGYQFLGGRAERFSTAAPQELDDIFKLDAGIGYSYGKFELHLMASNLLDKKIYSTAWMRNGLYYWVQQAPRSIRCALTLHL